MTSLENAAERRGLLPAILYIVLIFLYTLILGIPCMAISLFQPEGRLNYRFIRTWARLLLRTCGVKVEVHGRENIPSDGAFLIMSTHKSHFDIPVLITEIPRQFRIVAKESLFKIPVFGWVMTIAGYVKVDRANQKQAFASLDKAADNVRTGMPLLIFPEGTRSPDGSLGPFKKGGFVLAIKAGAPLVPVVVDGTFSVLPKTTWRIKPARVRAMFGEPIDVTGYSVENKERLMEDVHRAMADMK